MYSQLVIFCVGFIQIFIIQVIIYETANEELIFAEQ